jgi:hypothetical protein
MQLHQRTLTYSAVWIEASQPPWRQSSIQAAVPQTSTSARGASRSEIGYTGLARGGKRARAFHTLRYARAASGRTGRDAGATRTSRRARLV